MIMAGQTVGPFRLESFINSGGVGQVWKGWHTSEGVPVAVKFIMGELSDEQRRLVRAEAHSQARLVHPGIVRIYDLGEVAVDDEGSQRLLPYMAMELVEGGSLAELTETPPWREVRSLLVQILDALAHAHARASIHRDIKPENVLICRTDPSLRYKLADFGLAHAVDRHGLDRPDEVVAPVAGTLSYMAPEQFHGSWREFGPWTDLYQVGAMAWEMLTGTAPFKRRTASASALAHVSEPLPDFVPLIDLPDGVEAWLRKMLEKCPRDRYRHASDAAWALMWLGQKEHPGETGRGIGRRPLPSDWRSGVQVEESMSLVGAGLALFELREQPFVGRQTERTRMWQELRRVRNSDEVRVIAIEGEPGAGKSTLARWLGRRADEVGAGTPMRALHSPGRPSGYAIAEMFETYFRTWGLDRQEMMEHVGARLQHLTESGPERVDADARALSEFIRANIPLPDQVSQSARPLWLFGSTEECFLLFGRICRAIARDRPLIIGLDDLQYDSFSLDWVRHLIDGAPFPICFVATLANNLTGAGLEVARGIRELKGKTTLIELKALKASQHLQIVREMLPLHPDVARYVARQSSGKPMYARQIIGDWIRRRLLESTPDGFVLKDAEGRSRDPTMADLSESDGTLG